MNSSRAEEWSPTLSIMLKQECTWTSDVLRIRCPYLRVELSAPRDTCKSSSHTKPKTTEVKMIPTRKHRSLTALWKCSPKKQCIALNGHATSSAKCSLWIPKHSRKSYKPRIYQSCKDSNVKQWPEWYSTDRNPSTIALPKQWENSLFTIATTSSNCCSPTPSTWRPRKASSSGLCPNAHQVNIILFSLN